jgi:hypothetical protein
MMRRGQMQPEAFHSRPPAEWTGARALLEKWLARRCAVESVLNLAGGAFFLLIGLIALIFTSCVTAAIVFFVLIEATALLSAFGISISLLRPVLFALLFVFFLILTIIHAYRTRWGTAGAEELDVGGFPIIGRLGWEFISCGPILLVLSGQDFHKYLRLSRLEVQPVSALLLWLFEREGRASFAEISIAFPTLNAIRVLPQLRDIPGINWWPEDGELSLSEDLLKSIAETIRRPSPSSSSYHHSSRQRQYEQKPAAQFDPDIASWYATLDLPLFATLQEVKARYRKLAKIHHPDAQSANRTRGDIPNDEQMKRINEAYHNILKRSENHAGTAQ